MNRVTGSMMARMYSILFSSTSNSRCFVTWKTCLMIDKLWLWSKDDECKTML